MRVDGGVAGAPLSGGMRRSGLYRFRDRQSFKPSEVLSLFILSFFGGMFVFGICMLVSMLLDRVFGRA